MAEEKSEYEFEGFDGFVSELLCDNCTHGKSGACAAEPPCAAYNAIEPFV